MIGTIKGNEELARLPQFVWQLAAYICEHACPLVGEELGAIFAAQAGMFNFFIYYFYCLFILIFKNF
jgi:hypothetical protein